MKCFQCRKEIRSGGIIISIDGDFVCDEECRAAHTKEMDHFFSDIVHDEKKVERWIQGEGK